MRALIPLLLTVAACWGDNAYILQGVVVDRPSATEVVIAHDEIAGLMPAMTMPFAVRDASVLDGVKPGDRVLARLLVEPDGSRLARVRVVGTGAIPGATLGAPPVPVRSGEVFPALTLPIGAEATWALGEGQGVPTALSFIYTRCPLPEFCAATVARMQALQAALSEGEGVEARILLVTLDPAFDTPEVLARYAEAVGADPQRWAFGRVEGDALRDLAGSAGLPVVREDGEILHAVRTLVLDADGRLVERYDDNRWPLDRVVTQLRTGGPPAPPGTSGTLTP